MSEETGGQTSADTTTNQTSGDAGQGQTQEASQAAASEQSASWLDALDADGKNYVSKKGFKEPKDVLQSYINLEKLHGVPQDRLLKLPETLEGDDAAPLWEKLGKPKEASEYTFELHESVGDKE
jgi:hypothetical protein